MMYRLSIDIALLLILFLPGRVFTQPIAQNTVAKHGTVVTEHFESQILRDNLVGIQTRRSMSIYLPPGYHESKKSYPVIYYFHNIGWSNERMFPQGSNVQATLDRVISKGIIRDFILVAPDYTSPTIGSWFENSEVSGRWLDYTIEEVVPFVDSHFRTIARKDCRALTGEYMGGYGALKFAMLYPDVFGVVYGLHPVAAGEGLMPTKYGADWKRIFAAKEFKDLWGDHYAPGFVAMAQAYLPNPKRPPFFCDFVVELVNGEPRMVGDKVKTLQSAFLLDRLVDVHEANFRKLTAIAFDWGRYDQTIAHVTSLQAFTRKLDQMGIDHTAEEYNGSPNDKTWIEHGRVEDRVMPFFQRFLEFGE